MAATTDPELLSLIASQAYLLDDNCFDPDELKGARDYLKRAMELAEEQQRTSVAMQGDALEKKSWNDYKWSIDLGSKGRLQQSTTEERKWMYTERTHAKQRRNYGGTELFGSRKPVVRMGKLALLMIEAAQAKLTRLRDEGRVPEYMLEAWREEVTAWHVFEDETREKIA